MDIKENFLGNYVNVIKDNYFNFEGTADRSNFWLYNLFYLLVGIAIAIVSETLFQLYSLALLLPSFGIAARRLHDIGKSAWWLLLLLLPFIGFIILLVFWCLPTKTEENSYAQASPSTEPQALKQSPENKLESQA